MVVKKTKEVIADVEIIKPVSTTSVPPSFKEGSPTQKEKKPLLTKKAIFLCIGVLILLVLIWFFVIFLPNSHRFSFNIDGVLFVSDEFTPIEFFKEVKAQEKLVIFSDFVDGSTNPWMVNAINLWLIAGVSDRKQTVSVVRTINKDGGVLSCLTNDGNVLSSRTLSIEECNLISNDSNSFRVFLKLGNSNKVLMEKNKIVLSAVNNNSLTFTSYIAIKQAYPDFNKTLAIINEKIGSIE